MSICDHCPLSVEIVEAIAKARDCDPVNMAPMSQVIDLCALDAFDANSTGTWSLQFEYEGLLVTVRSDETITVDEKRDPTQEAQ